MYYLYVCSNQNPPLGGCKYYISKKIIEIKPTHAIEEKCDSADITCYLTKDGRKMNYHELNVAGNIISTEDKILDESNKEKIRKELKNLMIKHELVNINISLVPVSLKELIDE